MGIILFIAWIAFTLWGIFTRSSSTAQCIAILNILIIGVLLTAETLIWYSFRGAFGRPDADDRLHTWVVAISIIVVSLSISKLFWIWKSANPTKSTQNEPKNPEEY